MKQTLNAQRSTPNAQFRSISVFDVERLPRCSFVKPGWILGACSRSIGVGRFLRGIR